MKASPARVLWLVFLCLTLLLPGSLAEGQALKEGSKGKAVSALHMRLFDLGYLGSVKKAGDRYNKTTTAAVISFQAANGLETSGLADAATQDRLYAPGAVKAPLPEGRPLYNIVPDAAPPLPVELMPLTDDEGFLPPGSAHFLYENREDGVWCYLSDRLCVHIIRCYQAEGQLEWFEAYVQAREGVGPISLASKRDGKIVEPPLKIAQRENVFFAITDDFYYYRAANNERTGVIIRDGVIRGEKTVAHTHNRFPTLDVLALFEDGSMRTFASDAHTAREYLDMGVTDTWAFGPTLVQEGEVPRYFYSQDYQSYREPRCALGMIGPGEYCALMVTGRKTSSKGATLGWMAEKMLAMGAVEALNLDGGGTAAIIFNGQLINRSELKQSTRSVSGLIAFH
ncbi:MAG: phosphodiester glycosidase family protein [Christensenellales bacterium]|jgi:hypothetical protein